MSSHFSSSAFLSVFLVLVIVSVPHVHALTFGVIGDWGIGGYAAGWAPEVITITRYREICGQLGCNFTISVGDNFYCGDVHMCIRESFEAGFRDFPGPFFPVIGNHDMVSAQIKYSQVDPRWHFPSNYYTVVLPIDSSGYTVQLFMANTMDGSISSGGEQYRWLDEQLSKSTARWKIIVAHHPITGSGRHRRESFVGKMNELLEKHAVNAYFNGHDHIIEMSNIKGRVVGTSGAVARGPMMLRSIANPKTRKFTLTHPGEYNDYAQDWGSRGFMTVDLTPNVMTVSIWEGNGGLFYECTVTHDWILKAKNLTEEEQNEWPPPSVVLAAMKEEMHLPRGPGGGTAFLANGTQIEVPLTVNSTEEVIEPTPTETNKPTDAPTETSKPSDVPAEREDSRNSSSKEVNTAELEVPATASYAVFAGGTGHVIERKRFSIRLDGFVVPEGGEASMFLTNIRKGCELGATDDAYAPGTRLERVVDSVQHFNVSTAIRAVFVCLSLNGGKTYTRLPRDDADRGVSWFAVERNPEEGGSPPPSGGSKDCTYPAANRNAVSAPTVVLLVLVVFLAAGYFRQRGHLHRTHTRLATAEERSELTTAREAV